MTGEEKDKKEENSLKKEENKIIDILIDILIIMILIGIGAVWLFKNRDPKHSSSQTKTEEKDSKEETYDKNTVAYMSELEELINKYNIDTNDSYAFFKLLNAIIKDGKKFAIEKFKQILNSDMDLKSIAERFLEEYEKLKSEKNELKFNWGQKDKNSKPISASILSEWAKEFGLEDELKKEPRKAFELIIREKLYQYGIDSVLKKLKVEREYIEKYLETNNVERLKELLDETIETIKKDEDLENVS